jgi:hypothetical protein
VFYPGKKQDVKEKEKRKMNSLPADCLPKKLIKVGAIAQIRHQCIEKAARRQELWWTARKRMEKNGDKDSNRAKRRIGSG